MKTRELELVEERLKQSTHHQKVEELEAYQTSIGVLCCFVRWSRLERILEGKNDFE